MGPIFDKNEYLFLLSEYKSDNETYIKCVDTSNLCIRVEKKSDLILRLEKIENYDRFIRNFKIVNNDIRIVNAVQNGQLVVLYKIKDNKYLISDNNCIIRVISENDLVSNINKFNNIIIRNDTISSLSGEICYTTKRLDSMVNMKEFNYKAALLGIRQLSYDVDYCGNINILTSLGNEPKVVIPNMVTSIGNHAFYECRNIRELHIGNGVKTIGIQAFYYCENLRSVKLGEGIEEIQHSAFEGCKKLKNIEFNENLRIIRPEAFMKSAIENVKFNNNLVEIGYNAFSYTNILELKLSNTSMKYFDFNIVRRCKKLKNIEIPEQSRTLTLRYEFYFETLDNIQFTNSIVNINSPNEDELIKLKKYLLCMLKKGQLNKVTINNIITLINEVKA